jgi:hypothetical protein
VKARAAIGLVLLAVVGGAVVLIARTGNAPAVDGGGMPPGAMGASTPAPAGTAAPAGLALAGPTTCLPCHAQVVEEWKASMHSQAFIDPQVRAPDQSDNFTKQECLPCHAPAPVFEQGIAKDTRVLARVERRADGVDCLSCHATGDGVAAMRAGLTAACKPVQRAELATEMACQACHNQHNTHDEWRVSPAAAAGKDCASCHMSAVQRTGEEAGAPRVGASHRFLGGRDKEFALSGLSVTHAIDGKDLVVTLHNDFAGHNLPTDSRNRAMDLVVTVFDAHGQPVAKPASETRDPGCENGTARARFRNPYRASGLATTQLPAGKTFDLHVPLPDGASRAVVDLVYKLEPWIPDREAHWALQQEIPLAKLP